MDYLYKEWNNKAAGFVSYGSSGGIRAVEHLRAVAGELQMADVRAQVALPFATEFETTALSSTAAGSADPVHQGGRGRGPEDPPPDRAHGNDSGVAA